MANVEDCRTLHTRKSLFDTIFMLLEKESLDKISVVDICREANVHRTTFYSHFQDKYDLVYAAFNNIREILFDGFTQQSKHISLNELSRVTAVIVFEYIAKYHDIIFRIFANNKNPAVHDILRKVVECSITDMLSYYKGKVDYLLPLSVISGFLTGGFINLGMMYVGSSHIKIENTELTQYIDIILQQGLYMPKD